MEVTIEELKEFEGCSDDELAFSVIIKFISGEYSCDWLGCNWMGGRGKRVD